MRLQRIIVITAVLCVLCTFPEAARVRKLHAVQQDEKGKWQRIDVLREMRLGVSIQIRYVDPKESGGMVAKVLGRYVPLLRGPSGERDQGHMAFVLQVNNDSVSDVHFNPTQARLTTEKGDMMFALEYTEFYEISQKLGNLAPTTDEVASAFFDRDVTIRPGGSVRKLLAFNAPRDARYRKLDVRLLEVNIGSQVEQFFFHFRNFKEKE